MPTKMPTVRRSGRNSGKKIASPQYKHDLFKDPEPTRGRKKKVVTKVSKKKVAKKKDDDKYVPSSGDEEEEDIVEDEVGEVSTGSHPSKNYTKIALYDRWVRSRNEATDNRNELEALEKDSRKDKKEISKLVKELDAKSVQVVNLQKKLESKQEELDAAGEKSKKDQPSNTAIIANIKATYDHLKKKDQFEHKTELCDLNYKFKELQVLLENKNDKIARLEEENKDLKKNYSSVTELKVASLKSKIQIQSMCDKSYIK